MEAAPKRAATSAGRKPLVVRTRLRKSPARWAAVGRIVVTLRKSRRQRGSKAKKKKVRLCPS